MVVFVTVAIDTITTITVINTTITVITITTITMLVQVHKPTHQYLEERPVICPPYTVLWLGIHPRGEFQRIYPGVKNFPLWSMK